MPAWFNTNWKFRKKITIDNTQVAGSVGDFPVLVLTTDTDLRDDAQPNGSDILFTSSDGITIIPHEIEKFVGSTGEVVLWVKESLSASVDTDIYMYYGNADSPNQEDPTNVWDTNYQGVWHLSEDPGPGSTGDIKDSTSNNNDLTSHSSMIASDLVDAQINDGLKFDGVDDVISSSDVVDVPGSAITISLWHNASSFPGTNRFLVLKGQEDGNDPQNYQLLTRSTGGIDFDFFNVTFNTHAAPASSLIAGSTQFIVVTYDGASVKIYVDGIVVLDEAETETMLADAEDFAIGGAFVPVATRTVDAILDEVRISDISRASTWIVTEHNNQLSPSAFHTFGPEENVRNRVHIIGS